MIHVIKRYIKVKQFQEQAPHHHKINGFAVFMKRIVFVKRICWHTLNSENRNQTVPKSTSTNQFKAYTTQKQDPRCDVLTIQINNKIGLL